MLMKSYLIDKDTYGMYPLSEISEVKNNFRYLNILYDQLVKYTVRGILKINEAKIISQMGLHPLIVQVKNRSLLCFE